MGRSDYDPFAAGKQHRDFFTCNSSDSDRNLFYDPHKIFAGQAFPGFEGKSIAIQEAQTLGLPIIASESNREQIENGVDGILCRLEPEAVSEAVCRMMEDEKLRNRYREASLKKNVVYEKDMELLTGLLFR